MSNAVTRVFLVIVTICCTTLPQGALAAYDVGAGKAAVVNGVAVTVEAYRNELRRLERRERGGAEPLLKKQALENLIQREILYQEALRRGLQVSPRDVAGELTALREKLKEDGALEKTLDRLGIEQDQLEEQLMRGMAIQKLLDQELGSPSPISDGEVARYYKEHPEEYLQPLRFRLSHILIKTPPQPSGDEKSMARARIEKIRARLAAGEDFAVLARELSDCYSAHSGGDLGYFTQGQLSRDMERKALDLQPGEVSGVVEDRYGFHILKVTEMEQATTLSLAKASTRIRQELARQKQLKALLPLLKKLRAEAKVEILLQGD